MNKKDVLGLRLLPGITGKMESTPPLVQCRNCSKYGTQQGMERRDVLAVSGI